MRNNEMRFNIHSQLFKCVDHTIINLWKHMFKDIIKTSKFYRVTTIKGSPQYLDWIGKNVQYDHHDFKRKIFDTQLNKMGKNILYSFKKLSNIWML